MTTPASPTLRRSEYALMLLLELLEQTPIGEKLKPERELASEFGVSRRVIRDALDKLESQGRVARAPGRGTVVIDPAAVLKEKITEQKRAVLVRPTQNEAFEVPESVILGGSPMDLMEARLVLEPAIAAAAAMHASTQDIHKMHEYLELGRGAQSAQEWEQWDSALHQQIGVATHNQLLQYFYQVLSVARAQTEWGRLREQSLSPKNQQIYTEQHASILVAIQARDPQQAAETMRAHLYTVKRTLIEGLDI